MLIAIINALSTIDNIHFFDYNNNMKKIIVSKKYDNKKLNNFILDSFPNLSPNTLYKALRQKDIRINNVKVSNNQIIHYGDEITIYIADELLLNMQNILINKIYEDNNILIINKPEGIQVIDKDIKIQTITTILKSKYEYIKPCHRIDRNTKGLVLFAKNE